MMVRVTIDDMIEQLRDVSRDGAPVLHDPVLRDTLVKMIMDEKRWPWASGARTSQR